MYKLMTTLLLATFCFYAIACNDSGLSNENSKSKTITIKKGQRVDLLTGIRKPGTDEILNNYFGQIFPIASKYGFKVDGTFLTVAPPTKGNFHSSFLSVMSWTDPNGPDKFRNEAKKLSYDYVAERRNIWSVFNLTEYSEIEKDIEFTVSSDKVYVITAYWLEDADAFRAAKKEAGPKMQAAGGKKTVLFGKGKSPNGYLYEPDVISITEWETKESFEKYHKSTDPKVNDAGVRNVNQWITQFLFQ